MRQPLEDVVLGVEAFHTRPSRDDVLSTFSGPVHVITGADDVLSGVLPVPAPPLITQTPQVVAMKTASRWASVSV
jgi:hypothetical protein